MEQAATISRRSGLTVLAYPFRAFFLLTALYAMVIIVGWVAYLTLGLPIPLDIPPLYWHGHEMLMGIVPAAIAGFLLTAMTNWTGAPPLRGAGLLALIAVWLAGRVVMWIPALLPYPLVAAVDLLFMPVLAVYVFRVLQRAGNRRNFLIAGVLATLTVANALMHLGIMKLQMAWFGLGEYLALDLIAVLIVIIAGRITPAFTANWLRMHGGNPAVIRRPAWLEWTALAATVAMIPADLIGPGSEWAGAVALLAALANAVRLAAWGGHRTLREPLLWILHLGYLWLVLALALKGLAPWLMLPRTLWVHAMGTGCFATLILGVMTRVSLGHTGRPMRLPAGASLIYWLITAAAALRVGLAGGLIGGHGTVLALVGIFWTLAFGLFFAYYLPILTQPRADGRPG